MAKKMLEIAFSHSITKIVIEFTRVTDTSQSVLDLIFVSDNISEYNVSVADGISDHKMALLFINCDKKSKTSVPRKFTYNDYKGADVTSILDHL
ncbi:MAG: hypothetical protein O7D30_10845 [Rickettsia endosymbiont of Ixodes persulcatus]|nr:hypothetical protein [Rickettsia endosymbiont of Ixodes persulcatus]